MGKESSLMSNCLITPFPHTRMNRCYSNGRCLFDACVMAYELIGVTHTRFRHMQNHGTFGELGTCLVG
jgi:hypothetical protein